MVEGSEEEIKRTCNVGLVMILAIQAENAIKIDRRDSAGNLAYAGHVGDLGT